MPVKNISFFVPGFKLETIAINIFVGRIRRVIDCEMEDYYYTARVIIDPLFAVLKASWTTTEAPKAIPRWRKRE